MVRRERKKPKHPMRLFLILAFTLYGFLIFLGPWQKMVSLQHNVHEMEQQIHELEGKNARLRQEINKVNSNDYVEKTAREKLGLIKQGEKVVIPTTPDALSAGNADSKKPSPPIKD